MFNYPPKERIIIPILIVILLFIAVVLGVLLRNKDDKIKNIPLLVITVLILLLEITKQILSIVDGSYSSWTVPLHFCSLFIYFFPIATMCKGRFQKFGQTMAFVSSCWLLILFYFNPTSVLGDACNNIFGNFYNFHTIAYHHLAMLYALICISLRVPKLDKFSFLYVAIGITAYAAVALPVAHIFSTNYCNMLESNISFMESFRIEHGQILYTILLYLVGVVGGFAIYALRIATNKLFYYQKEKNNGGDN